MPGEADISEIQLFRQLTEAAWRARPPEMQARRAPPLWLMSLGLIGLDGLAAWSVFLARRPDQVAVDSPLALFLVLAMATQAGRGLYSDVERLFDLRLMARALVTVLATSLLAAAMLRGEPDLAGTAATLALTALAMLGGRAIAQGALASVAIRASNTSWLAPRVLLVGAACDMPRLLVACRGGVVAPRVLGWIDHPTGQDGCTPPTMPGLPRLGGINRLDELARAGLVDRVILAVPAREAPALARRCAAGPVDIRLAQPAANGWDLVPMLRAPVDGWAGLLKRTEDLALGALLLAVFALPMALLALAIRLDSPGPVLFRQHRTGFRGQHFQMLKFRTMRHDPAPLPGCVQAVRDDPRVTRLGAFLRRTSLDELPQLLNVLRGEMSLVGPRPHAPGTPANGRPFEDVVPFYAGRHRVKPGITGLAQVRGLRGETRTEADVMARVDADYEYIDRWSLGLDLLILLRTALAVLSMRNAY